MYITNRIAGTSANAGKLNSGIVLSGDTMSPHLLGLGILNGFSGLKSGHE